MKIVLLDTATLGEDMDLSPIASVREDISVISYPNTSADLVAERLLDADVVILNKIKLNESNLSTAKQLKLICVTATGYDNIDTAYCQTRGIALCNVPAYCSDSVAQVTAAIALSLINRLTEYRDFVHSGAYTKSGIANSLSPVYHEMSSLTWGVVGGGNIGSRVAGIAKALGCRVLLCRRKADSRYEQADIDTLCREADIISLHVPLTDSTRNLIHAQRIALMKSSAVIINMARGAVIDEAAVALALQEGRLGGLGADVYSSEPFGTDHPFFPLLDRSNVCLTPHMSWGAKEARDRCIAVVCDNIRSYFAGETLNRIV